jgi:GNAT superfamily N-acetyltransferase
MNTEYHFPADAEQSASVQTQTVVDEPEPVVVRTAIATDAKYALFIVREIKASAIARGTGIRYRTVESICEKISSGNAIIATTQKGKWVGFSYVDVWENGKFVSNSGMIVSPGYRGQGIAKIIKKQIFDLCRNRYPQAQIFSITTSSVIMKLNTQFGFVPVSFAEITKDKDFWHKCRHCVNYNILESKEFTNCLCTAMRYNIPEKKEIATG